MIVPLGDAPDVVAVIPTLAGNLPRLRSCLDSVCGSRFDGRLSVVVVWNDPRVPVTDFGTVTILHPGMNLGLPGGMNFARQSVTAPRMWIVQDDMTVAAECLTELVRRQDLSDAPVIVSPVILNEHGNVPERSRAGTITADGVMDEWYPFEECPPEDLDPDVGLDWVSLSGALVRCDAWDAVGGMDPAFYPLMHSDVDFGHRVTSSGMKVVLEPKAVISHERNGSTPSLFARFLYERNSERFEMKHRLDLRTQTREIDETPESLESTEAIVGREASVLIVDYAKYAESYVDGTREMISALEASVLEHHQHFLNVRGELDGLQAAVHERDRGFDDVLVALEQERARNQQLLASRSMRITRPLRWAGSMFRRIRGD